MSIPHTPFLVRSHLFLRAGVINMLFLRLIFFRWLPLFLWAFHAIPVVRGELYVAEPSMGSVCHGGQPCTVSWNDDGTSPLLTSIGPCTVGLYTGNQHLIQQIQPVDVSQVHGFTFTPNPKAGPNSDLYYVAFTSASLLTNRSEPYIAYSPAFTLDNMLGSFDTPIPSATSSIAIPSSIASAPPNTISGTITISRSPPATLSAPTTLTVSSTLSPSSLTRIPLPSTSIVPPTTSPLASAIPTRTNAGRQVNRFPPLTLAFGILFTVVYHY